MHRPPGQEIETAPRIDPPGRPTGAPLAAVALLAGLGTIAEAVRGVEPRAAAAWLALLAAFSPWLVARVARAAWWAAGSGESRAEQVISALGAGAVPFAFAAGCLACLPAGPYPAPMRILAGTLVAAGPGLALMALGVVAGGRAARAGVGAAGLARLELVLATAALVLLELGEPARGGPAAWPGAVLAELLVQPLGRLAEGVVDPAALAIPLAGLLLIHLGSGGKAGEPAAPTPPPQPPPLPAAPVRAALGAFSAAWGPWGPLAVLVAGGSLGRLARDLGASGLEPESALVLAEVVLASVVTQAAPLWVPGRDEAPPPTHGPGAAADHAFRVGMLRALAFGALLGFPVLAAGLWPPVLGCLFLAETMAFALPTVGISVLGRHGDAPQAGLLYLFAVVPWVLANLTLDWLFVPVVRARLALELPTVELWLGLKGLSLAMAAVLGAYVPLLRCAEDDAVREVPPCPNP